MNFKPNIYEKSVQKDKWFKSLIKASNPEIIADLIVKRLNTPHSNGPTVCYTKSERPCDILIALLEEGDSNQKERLEKSIGLILYESLHDKRKLSYEVLSAIFNIIEDSSLSECYLLVHAWVAKNTSLAKGETKLARDCFKHSLYALARTQPVNEDLEKYWLDLWNESSSNMWPVSFLGLRLQNPSKACSEIGLMVQREANTPSFKDMGRLLMKMWRDDSAKHHLELALKDGIVKDTIWSGIALNALIGKLNKEDVSKLFSNMKEY